MHYDDSDIREAVNWLQRDDTELSRHLAKNSTDQWSSEIERQKRHI